MNYRISAPGFLLAVLLSGGVVPASAQGELSQELVAQPESSAIANPEIPAAGTAEAALAEGRQAYHQGQLPLALERLSQAIAQFEAEGNTDGVAAAQVAIAPVYITMENLDEAATAIQAALSYYQAEGSVAGEAQALVALGELQISEKDYDAALASLQQAIDLSEQTQDSFTQGKALLYVGVIYGNQEDYASALTYIDQALPLLQDDSDTLHQGYYQTSALTLQAMSLIGLEEFDPARALIEPIQNINQSLQHPAFEGYLFLIHGTLVLQQGDVDAALENYQRSLELFQLWSFSREAEILLYSAIGGIYFEQQDLEQASLSFDQILTVLAEQGNVSSQLEFLFQIGNLYQENGYYTQAQAYYEATLPFAQATSRAAEGTVLNRVGYMLYLQEQYELALEFLLPAFEAMQDAGNHADKPAVLGNTANTYQQLGKLEKAEEYRLQIIAWHQENLASAERHKNHDATFYSLNQISIFYADQSRRFINIGNEYLKSDPQEAINAANNSVEASEAALSYAQQIPQIAQTDHREKWLIEANSRIAIALISTGQAYWLEAQAFTALNQLQRSLESQERALDLIKEALPFALASENETLRSSAYNTLISSYQGVSTAANSAGNYERAIESGLKALQISQEINNVENELSSLATLSDPHIRLTEHYHRSGQSEKALESLAQAESFNREIIAISDSSDTVDLDRSEQKSALGRLWVIFLQRQGIYSDQNLHERSLEAAYETLNIAQRLKDDSYVGISLKAIAESYRAFGQYSKALIAYENARQFAEDNSDFSDQSSAFLGMAIIYLDQSQYSESIEKFEEALAIARDHSVVQYQVLALNGLSSIYLAKGEYDQAIEELNIALSLMQENRTLLEGFITPELLNENCYLGFSALFSESEYEEDDFLRDNLAIVNYQRSLDEQLFEDTRASCIKSTWEAESSLLIGIGTIYSRQGRYPEAIDAHEKSLAIDREIGSGDASEAVAIGGLGNIYQLQGDYENALALYEQVLEIYTRNNELSGQASALNGIAIIYDYRGQYANALDYYQQALTLAEQSGRQNLQNSIMFNLGSYPGLAGDFQSVLNTYYEVLEVERLLGRKADEAITLSAIGGAYYSQARLDLAEQAYTEALAIAQEIGTRGSEIDNLGGLGDVAEARGDYSVALNYYQQALEIAEEINSQARVSGTLLQLGIVYLRLGQYSTALDYYQRSLAIDMANGIIGGQAATLSSIAGVYYRQQQYDQALDYNQQALGIHQEIGNLVGQVRALDGIGIAHERQGNYEQALATYQQALDLVSDMDARSLQASVLGGLGLTYAGLDDTEQAMDYFEQALAIHRDIGNPSGEALVLADIGKALAQSNQPELSIAFYKQSVNTREGIRAGLQELDQSLQQSYADTVADTYRELADLLLQQDRVLEAQRVLDLLKVQELDDYLQNVRGTEQTANGLDLWEPEQRILALYDQTIQEGGELAALEAKTSLTAAETQRRDELLARQDELRGAFRQFRERQDVREAIAQLRTSTDGQNVELSHFNQLQNSLAELGTNAVLLYPLILDDRLELVLITPNSSPIRRSVPVSAADLNRAIVELGQALKNPQLDAQAPAQRLYEWLIAPIANDLAAANAETIIYAPDGALRYIPLGALHDGEAWLAQRFAVSHITAASLIDFTARPSYRPDNLNLLAAACVQCSFENINGYRFADLPHAGVEVETLAAQIPNTELRLNAAFSASELRTLMRRFSVVHLATHAKFLQGQGGESFIVTGDENSVSLREMQNWNLDADLVVLSACETAVGEAQLGSGVEILGFGYQMQGAGAKAAIASLWQVSDGGTQVLMNAFYAALQAGHTKAKALQLAQQALISGEFEVEGQGDRADFNLVTARTGLPAAVSDNLDHPYYWAPFILIGNGL